jgi:hypothetical protein
VPQQLGDDDIRNAGRERFKELEANLRGVTAAAESKHVGKAIVRGTGAGSPRPPGSTFDPTRNSLSCLPTGVRRRA